MIDKARLTAVVLAIVSAGGLSQPADAQTQLDRPTQLLRSDATSSPAQDATTAPPNQLNAPGSTPPAPLTTVSPANGTAPPPSMLDISSGSLGKLDVEVLNGKFNDAAVDKLHLSAADLDFKASTLKSLAITVSGGHFQDFIFDQLALSTQGDLMRFDASKLLNDKVLQFSTPAEATVAATVSQDSLNAFLSSPRVLEHLSVTANKRVGMLAAMLGANPANFGITLSEAAVALLKQNRISFTTSANVGMGGMGVPLPLELNAKLGLENGWIAVTDTHLNTNGQEISPQLSEMLVKKINGLASWSTKSDDIQFSFTDLKVVAGKQFTLKGTAKINRLSFGKPSLSEPKTGE